MAKANSKKVQTSTDNSISEEILKKRILTLGIDIGNANIKTSKDFKIESKIAIGHDNLDESNVVRVEFDGIKYTIGKGNPLNFTEKYFETEYKILLLTAISESIKESNINVNICIGMPISLYRDKDFTNRVVAHIKNFGSNEIKLNGSVKTIKINDVSVWLEGGILFYNYEKYSNMKLLVVDIGGYSVDILQIMKGKISENDSFDDGIYTLSNAILNEINKEYKSDLKDGSAILDAYVSSKEYEIGNRTINMRIVDALVKNYADGLISRLNQRFSMSDCHILFIGGGALVIKDKLKRFTSYDIDVLEKPEYINSYTYENICIQKYS